MKAELVLDCKDLHGEGVFWSAEHHRLLWTDILGKRIAQFDPLTYSIRQFSTPARVCAFATRQNRSPSELIAAFDNGFAFLNLDSGDRQDIVEIDREVLGVRMNDGKIDRQGRFIVGGMDEKGFQPTASVWRLDADLKVYRLFEGVACANGICFSPDGRRMWFADSSKRAIEAFDYDTTYGLPSNRRIVALTNGVPDGSCVDREGFVWNAVWEGYRVERYSPEGQLDLTVDLPVKKPTCCAFGGHDLDTLYITSSRLGETEADLIREPTAGGLFAIRPGVCGVADHSFAG